MKKMCARLASLGALFLSSTLAMELKNTDPLNTNQPTTGLITIRNWTEPLLNIIERGAPNYRMDKSDSQDKLKDDLQEAKKFNDKLSFRISQLLPENISILKDILSEHAENINYLFIKLHPYCRSPNLPEILEKLSIIENWDGLGVEYKKLESGHLAQIKNLTIMKNYTTFALTPGEEFVVFFKNGVLKNNIIA